MSQYGEHETILKHFAGRDPKALPKRGKRQQEITTEWDKVIADAERRIERLRLAVKICREMKAAGEPWPGSFNLTKAAGEPWLGKDGK